MPISGFHSPHNTLHCRVPSPQIYRPPFWKWRSITWPWKSQYALPWWLWWYDHGQIPKIPKNTKYQKRIPKTVRLRQSLSFTIGKVPSRRCTHTFPKQVEIRLQLVREGASDVGSEDRECNHSKEHPENAVYPGWHWSRGRVSIPIKQILGVHSLINEDRNTSENEC